MLQIAKIHEDAEIARLCDLASSHLDALVEMDSKYDEEDFYRSVREVNNCTCFLILKFLTGFFRLDMHGILMFSFFYFVYNLATFVKIVSEITTTRATIR